MRNVSTEIGQSCELGNSCLDRNHHRADHERLERRAIAQLCRPLLASPHSSLTVFIRLSPLSPLSWPGTSLLVSPDVLSCPPEFFPSVRILTT